MNCRYSYETNKQRILNQLPCTVLGVIGSCERVGLSEAMNVSFWWQIATFR